jgi:DNA-binding transcriptional MocR family regulator
MPAPLTSPPVRPTRYRALAERLAQELREGRHPPGAQLPSVRQLCTDHAASLATVTHALRELEDAGLVEARARQGYFARATPRPRPLPPSAPAIELEGRRRRLMELATTQPDCLSLSHLALPPALLPLAALRQHAARALAEDRSLLATGSAFGSEALRAQLALRMARAGCAVEADDLVVAHGEAESLELCLRLLTRPGDRVAIASPGSLRALEMIASLGLQALAIPSSPERGLSVQALDFALQHHAVACCIAEPSHDSAHGSAMHDDDRRQLAALLARYRLPLIECDLMGELQRGAQRPRPVKAWDQGDWVLYCGSLACVTGPGWSVGWIASRRHRLLLRAARTVHGDLLPSLTEAVLARFLATRAYDLHLRRLRQRLAAQVDAWARAARRHLPRGTRIHSGQGGYVLWVELGEGHDVGAALQRVRQQGYTFVPGTVFGSNRAFDHCLRLSAAHPLDEQRERGLRVLGAALRENRVRR